MPEYKVPLHFKRDGIIEEVPLYTLVTDEEVMNKAAPVIMRGQTVYAAYGFEGDDFVSSVYCKVPGIVYDGEGDTVRKYYKAGAWQQPVLSANGKLDGDDFAISASTETSSGSHYAYAAFDGSTSTYWRASAATGYLTIYNPVPLKVSAISWGNYYSYPTAGNVAVSKDGESWTVLKEWTNSVPDLNVSWKIDLSDNAGYFKYYRINITAINKDVVHCYGIGLTAVQRLEASRDDYELYEDKHTMLLLQQVENGSVSFGKPGNGSTYTFTAPMGVKVVMITWTQNYDESGYNRITNTGNGKEWWRNDTSGSKTLYVGVTPGKTYTMKNSWADGSIYDMVWSYSKEINSVAPSVTDY